MRMRSGRSWAAVVVVAAAASSASAQDFTFATHGHSVRIVEGKGATGSGGLSVSQDFSGQLLIVGTDGATLNGQAQVTAPADEKRTIVIVAASGNPVDFTDVKGSKLVVAITGGDASVTLTNSEFVACNIKTGPGAGLIGTEGSQFGSFTATCGAGNNVCGLLDTEVKTGKFVCGPGDDEFDFDHVTATGGALTIDARHGAATVNIDTSTTRSGAIGGSEIGKILVTVGPGGLVTVGDTKTARTVFDGAAKFVFASGAAGDDSSLSIFHTEFKGPFSAVTGAERDNEFFSGVTFDANGSLKLGLGDDQCVCQDDAFDAPFALDAGPGNDTVTLLGTDACSSPGAICARNVENASAAEVTVRAAEDGGVSLTINYVTGKIRLVGPAASFIYDGQATPKCVGGAIAFKTTLTADTAPDVHAEVTASFDPVSKTVVATGDTRDERFTFNGP